MTMEQVDFTDHAAVQARLQALHADHTATTSTNINTTSGRKILLWMETPSNPQCKVTDVQAISTMARELYPNPADLIVVVDSTWATPYLLNPLELGADFVMHSVTKYIGGHSDVLGGIVTASIGCVKRADEAAAAPPVPTTVEAPTQAVTATHTTPPSDMDMLTRLRTLHRVGGGVCGPLESWLALRGLRTLPVRLNHQCQRSVS
jgi:cystathionine gamma-synthase